MFCLKSYFKSKINFVKSIKAFVFIFIFQLLKDICLFYNLKMVVFTMMGEKTPCLVTSYNMYKKLGSASAISTNSLVPAIPIVFGRLSSFLEPFTNKSVNVIKQTQEKALSTG